MKAILLMKFVKISSLKNYRLYGRRDREFLFVFQCNIIRYHYGCEKSLCNFINNDKWLLQWPWNIHWLLLHIRHTGVCGTKFLISLVHALVCFIHLKFINIYFELRSSQKFLSQQMSSTRYAE